MIHFLINDMIDIKLIQQGVFKPRFAEFKPAETLNFLSAIFEPQMKLFGNNFVCRLDESVPEKLNGDEDRLKQAIINLIKNAM